MTRRLRILLAIALLLFVAMMAARSRDDGIYTSRPSTPARASV